MKTENLSTATFVSSSLKNENPTSSKSISLPGQEMKSIHELHQELIDKYDPKIVQNVFQNLSRYALSSLPLKEVTRIEVFCHYFDMEKRMMAELKTENKAAQRIFNRYLFHTREEISSRLKENYEGESLTHENIEVIKKHFEEIFGMVFLLLKRYKESICHRALNHFSILSSAALCGKEPLSSFDELCERIDKVFSKEQEITALLNVMPYEALQTNFDLLQKQIKQLKDPYAKYDLEKELILKCGKAHMLPPLLPKSHIEERANLFRASFDGTKWAESQEEISPLDHSIHKNINNVFFLKSSLTNTSKENVAVFKSQPNGKKQSGAMESLAYDVSLLFGINSGLVPTKQKDLKGMSGSIQIFQDGMSWTEFSQKSIEEQKRIVNKISMRSFLEAVIPILALGNRDVHMDNFFFIKKKKTKNVSTTENRVLFNETPLKERTISLESQNEKDFLSEPLFEKVESLQQTSIDCANPSCIDDDDEYGIVVFDNEFTFQYSNYVLTSFRKEKVPKIKKPTVFTIQKDEKKQTSLPIIPNEKDLTNKREIQSAPLIKEESIKAPFSKSEVEEEEEVVIRESILPIRCAIMALPQADTLITGEDKIWLQELVATWPKSFDNFFSYLNSPPGKEKLNQLPYKALDRYQLKAFNDRLQKLINIIHSKEEYTPRDLLIRLFPLYPAFYSLTEMLYPDFTEFAVGAKSAEYLCKKAVKLKKISQEKANSFLDEVYRLAEK